MSNDELDELYQTHLLNVHKFTVSKTTKIELNLVSELGSMPWYECGSHKCLVCERNIYLGTFVKHLTLAHKLALDEYLVIFELKDSSSVFDIPDLQCMVCQGAVTHTLSNIKSHLWVKHNMTMAD